MSLQVWLPLTKDLRNQGLSNVTVSIMRGNETWDNNGKLGKCFYANGVNTLQINNIIPQLYNASGYSLCAWFYIESQNTVHTGAGIVSGGNWNNQVLNLSVSDWVSGHYTRLRVSGTNWNNTYAYDFYPNIWYHAVVCSDGNKTYAYINGQLIGDTVAGFLPSSIEGNNIAIGGATYYSGMQFFGKINDVRIYDHCLSPMEVKQLSQGLVLHYPLNRSGFGQENLATCTTPQYNIAASTSNYNYFWINSSTLEPNTTYTFSAEVEVSDNITECTIYNYTSSGNSGSITSTFPADGKRHSWTFTTTTTGLGLIGYAGKSGATAGHSAVYHNIKVEKGEVATPYVPRSNEALYTTMGLNGTTEYDCSGFCNNGTRTGTFSWTNNTPKYAVSTQFNSTQYIETLDEISTTDSTIAVWVNTTLAANGFILECRNSSGSGKQPIYQYTNGSIQAGGSGKYVTTNTGLLVANTWIHLVIVQNGDSILVYKNGQLFQTISCTNSPIIRPVLGARYTHSGGFTGQLSDLRIYATALSADDVKSLYQNCATIDPDGTIRGQIRS